MKILQRFLGGVVFTFFLMSFWACQLRNEIVVAGRLDDVRFSTDSVKFDTVINELKTISKWFRLHNKSNNALLIDRVKLRNTDGKSPFSLLINGKKTNDLHDIKILGGDSVLILVQALPRKNTDTLPILVEDAVEVEFSGNKKAVIIQAWGQDAYFFKDSVITCDAVWRGTKPYVIMGDGVLIKENCKLKIEAGTQVLFMPQSYLFVFGELTSMGTPEKRVQFTSIRRDSPYDKAIGQWGGILFAEISKNNQLNYSDIRNSTVGIQSNAKWSSSNPFPISLDACLIENISTVGLLAVNSGVYARNTVINNCLKQTFAGVGGGNYRLEHCTLANFAFNFFREESLLVLRNQFEIPPSASNPNGLLLEKDLFFSMENSLVWGNLEEEFFTSSVPNVKFEITAENCLIKTKKTTFSPSNLLNKSPKFKDPASQIFLLDTLSPAKDFGKNLGILVDFLGKNRDAKPDVGAFERKE